MNQHLLFTRLRHASKVLLGCLLFLVYSANAQQLQGTVKDNAGEGLAGVSVLVKNQATGKTQGTLTNSTGNFDLRLSESGTFTLTASFIGFETIVLTNQLFETGKNYPYQLVLEPENKSLEQLVVVGYGSQKKRELTGAIANLSAASIKDQPVANLEQALIGKLPGVQVLQNTGAPGGSISVRIRGLNSISAGLDPLYVIDGFPISNDLSDLQGSTDVLLTPGIGSFQKSPNPMSSFNADDIESIEILKDAAAAAIYGSRGSNGVVLITTKKGSATGKGRISYNTYAGVQQVTRKVDLLDAYQWSQFSYDAKNTAYLSAVPTGKITDNNTVRANANYQIPSEILPYLAGNANLTNTDWQDAIFRSAAIQNHTLSAIGGSEKVQYYISGNYFDQDGIVIASGFKRYGLRANLLANPINRLKVGLSVNPTFSNHDLVNTEGPFIYDGIINNALKAAPIFPVYNPDGSYAINLQNAWAFNYSGGENPVALANEIKDKLKNVRLQGTTFAEYKILPNLSFKSLFGTDINYFGRSYYRPSTLGAYRPVQQTAPTNPTGSSQTAISQNWIWENTLNYNFAIDKHKFNVLLGYTSQKNRTEANFVTARNFPNDAVQTLNAGTVTAGSSTASEWSLISNIGRINYNLLDRYFVTASLRRDGSSRFGGNNKWGYFPSVSGAWVISDETFWKTEALSEVKLRVSYGQTGNFQIPNYGAYDLLSSNNYILGAGEGTSQNGVGLSQPSNPDLTWERTSQVNAGLDIGLLKNRIYLSADYYVSTTRDLLLNVPVPLNSGFSTALVNIGKVQNKGFELGITSNNLEGALKWKTNFNISANRNKVLQLGPENTPIISDGGVASLYITKVGEPIGSFFGYVNGGVFKNQAEIDAYPHYATAKPGDRKFIDVNNDGKIDANDRTSIGSFFPDFIWGLTNDFKYKNFDLSIAFQGVQGNEILNLQRRYLLNSEGNANQFAQAANYWKSDADPGDGDIIRANRVTNANSAQISSFHVEDGSYVRLRNVTLGYNFNSKLFGEKVENLRLYVSGQNLHTWTKYIGYNPEANARPTNALSQGEDYGSYPLPRTIIAGLNLTF